MNTFFLPKLLQGYDEVRDWTVGVDIFAIDIIIIPVHKNVHWRLAIIHFKDKAIRVYDSMGAPDNDVLDRLEKYLQEESLNKNNKQFDLTGWKKDNMLKSTPQQENGKDCGVFSCMYAEFTSRNRPFTRSAPVNCCHNAMKLFLLLRPGTMPLMC